MNNYLIEYSDSQSLKITINNIINKCSFNNININYYDLEEYNIDNVLDDLDTYGLFSDKKVIVVYNIDKLNIDDKSFNHLIKYLDNSNDDNLLILVAKKLNNTKKLTKELKKRVNYINTAINIKDYIKNELNGFEVSNNVINKLIEYCGDDLDKIYNECQKLINYKYEDRIITIEDIERVVEKKNTDITELSFDFVKYLFNKDKYNALLCYEELEKSNIEPYSLIGLLSSQLRIIYQVKILANKKYNDEKIADILDEKPYRIKKTRELIYFYSESELLNLIRELENIDFSIKTTDVDGKFLIQLFIINLKK